MAMLKHTKTGFISIVSIVASKQPLFACRLLLPLHTSLRFFLFSNCRNYGTFMIIAIIA